MAAPSLLVSYLKQHGIEGEDRIELQERPGARISEMDEWERANMPFKLPTDFRSFLSLNNGFHCKWTSDNGVFGVIHVNSLANTRPVVGASRAWDDWPEEEAGTEVELAYAARDVAQLTFFDLDSSCPDGRVALAYRTGTDPKVYFQDKDCAWHFVADSFSKYWQLMVLHMGLPHWQFLYTDSPGGPDPEAQQWFRYACPEVFGKHAGGSSE